MAALPSPEGILHLCTLHILSRHGFASTSRAASLTLSSVLAQYFRAVALACLDRSAEAGRAEVGALDVQQALEDLGVGGVEELYEWAVEEAQDGGGGVVWSWPGRLSGTADGGGEGGWGEVIKEGLARGKWEDEEALADLQYMPDEEIKRILAVDAADTGDEEMDVDVDSVEDDAREPKVGDEDVRPLLSDPWRSGSPDFSWLPPIPSLDGSLPSAHPPVKSEANSKLSPDIAAGSLTTAPASAPAPVSANMSLLERYERRIPFTSSQLAQSRAFVGPPNPPTPVLARPVETSSLPSLVEVYAKTSRRGASASLQQNEYRKHVTSLLRLSVAPADELSPSDTLAGHMPPPRTSPFVPSYSETLPSHPIPIDPHPTGMLAQLVRQVRSPFLPPKLRERLLSVRPPVVQKKDGTPIKYQPPVLGPSRAALELAKGKQPQAEDAEKEEDLLWPTWGDLKYDGTPRWKLGGLPSGPGVRVSKQGEGAPRRPVPALGAGAALGSGVSAGAGGGGSVGSMGPPAQGQGQEAGPSRFRLRLGSIGGPPSTTGAGGGGSGAGAQGMGSVGMARKDASGSGSGPGTGSGGASSPAGASGGPVRLKLSTRVNSGGISPIPPTGQPPANGTSQTEQVSTLKEVSQPKSEAEAHTDMQQGEGGANGFISLNSPTDPLAPTPTWPAPVSEVVGNGAGPAGPGGTADHPPERPRPRISLSFGRPKPVLSALNGSPLEPGQIVETPLAMQGGGLPTADLAGGAREEGGMDVDRQSMVGNEGVEDDEEEVPLAQNQKKAG